MLNRVSQLISCEVILKEVRGKSIKGNRKGFKRSIRELTREFSFQVGVFHWSSNTLLINLRIEDNAFE